jgi:hypothetical protein
MNDNDLIGEFDAMVWAERFVKRVTAKPTIATDASTMLAWFSGAIMAGYDTARRRNDEEPVLIEVLRQCVEALRLTREYVGEDLLPALPGWSWFDATEAASIFLGPLSAVGEPAKDASR